MPRSRSPDVRHADGGDSGAKPVTAPAAPTLAAEVLRLQRASGNHAVAALLARQPAPAAAPTGLPDRAPASAPSVPGQTRVVGAPPPVRVEKPEDGPHPSADLSAGVEAVTLTFLMRDLHLKGRDPATIDWLHEPGVEVEASQGRLPKPVLTAALSAMNAHLRVHGKDIAEVAVGAKAGIDHTGTPSAGAELKAQIQVTTTFSITAGTSLSASPRGPEGEPDHGKVPLTAPDSKVNLEWSPMSIGVQYKLEKPDKPDRPGPVDYGPDMEEGKIAGWVAGQLTGAELGPFDDRNKLVNELLAAMSAARSGEAEWTMHPGRMQEKDLPRGLTRTFTRIAELIARAKPSLRGVHTVHVKILRLDEAEKREKPLRWATLSLGAVTVASNPVELPAPPLRTWGAP